MNQLCKVCGEPAAGFHFGAFTCEGCKSFFGRTYNNISAISGCKNNGDCIINKKNRTACKACRLRKCLLVGMSKSGSRYGRRSNWFKIHCLLQEQQTQHHQNSSNNNNNNNSSTNNGSTKHDNQSSSPQQITSTNLEQFSLTHQHLMAKQTYQDKTNPSIKSVALQNSSILMNSFLPVNQILNGNSKSASNKKNINDNNNRIQYPQSKSEPMNRSRSPSDSGASSADPDENYSNSNKDLPLQQNSSIDGGVCSGDMRSDSAEGYVGCIDIKNDIDDEDHSSTNKSNSLLNSFGIGNLVRSSSEPLQNFQLFPKSYTSLTHPNAFIGNVLHPFANFFAPIDGYDIKRMCVDSQDEPIDLSVKATDCKSSPTILRTIEITTKPAPLDLTLVRSQPTSG